MSITDTTRDLEDETEVERKIVHDLKFLNVCNRCILRFLGHKTDFADKPDEYLEKVYPVSEPEYPKNYYTIKRFENNYCPACLGLLEDDNLDKCLSVLHMQDIGQYEFDRYMMQFRLPKCTLIREHSFRIYITDRYPGYLDRFQVMPVYKVLQHLIKNKILRTLNKRSGVRELFQINFTIGYEDDHIESVQIKRFNDQLYNKNNALRPLSKLFVAETLYKISDYNFKKHIGVPPSIPWKKIKISCNFTTNAYNFGGRFLQLIRRDDSSDFCENEDFVSDIVLKALESSLGVTCEKQFIAKGGDSKSVRVLGNGRPFVVQIKHPTKEFTDRDFIKLQNEVAKTNFVKIMDLKAIYKCEFDTFLRSSPNSSFRSVCKTDAPNIESVVDIINNYETVQIKQKTPIMHLVAKSAGKPRTKTIFNMKAEAVPGYNDLIILDIEAEHGTSILEFVNGDFNRTEPNLQSIIGHHIDVIVTDCINVDFEWPPAETDENVEEDENMIIDSE